MVKPELTKFAQVRPLGTSFRYPPENVGSRFSYQHSSHNKTGEIQESWEKNKTSNLSSSQMQQSGGHCSQVDKLKSEFLYINKSQRRRTKSSDSRDVQLCGPYKAVKREVSGSTMQTLDRRISASSDQLDTLKKQGNREKPLRTCSSSRLNFERKIVFEDSKNENHNPTFIRKNDSKRIRDGTKTPFEMFLEDDGPYSRKPYGPLTPKTPRIQQRTQERQSINNRQQNIPILAHQQREKIVYTNNLGKLAHKLEDDSDKQRPVKKGLLWQQKDKFFSRWKERFFILTEDYLHCFKKENSRITEMGSFILKLSLSEVDSVSLLTKKGYLTISLNHVKDGRVFLRRHEGIKEWYNMIKANVFESKKRRHKFDLDHNNSSVEAWLLARQNIAGSSVSTPYISKHATVIAGKTSDDNLDDSEDILRHEHDEKVHGNNTRGIHRLSLVADLIQNESVTTIAHMKNKDKHSEDSGLESGHSSMNTVSDSQTDVCNSDSEDCPASPEIKTQDTVRTSQHTSQSNRCGKQKGNWKYCLKGTKFQTHSASKPAKEDTTQDITTYQ